MLFKPSAQWSREEACRVFNVCDGRTISALAGETISGLSVGLIPPEVGTELFHLGIAPLMLPLVLLQNLERQR